MKCSIVYSATVLLIVAVLSGCTTDIGAGGHGSTGEYDYINFADPGPEFKLSREAAAQRQFAADQDLGP